MRTRRIISFFAVWLIALSAPVSKPAREEATTSHIPRQPVESSALAKVGYSKRRQILEVEFRNGRVYRYLDVPRSVYRRLMSAESKTRFYDFNIKGKFRSERVRPRVKDGN